MAITAAEFDSLCRAFVSDPSHVRAGWTLKEWDVPEHGDPELCYTGIACRNVRCFGGVGAVCDINVCWHPVYEVPSLCFTAYDADTGAVVRARDLDRYMKYPEGVETGDHNTLGMQPESVLSAAAHPVTQEHTLAVHPCETRATLQLMGVGAGAGAGYLMAFLSVVGPLMGLPGELCQPQPLCGSPA